MNIGLHYGFGDSIAHEHRYVKTIGFEYGRQHPRVGDTEDRWRMLLSEYTVPNAPKLIWLTHTTAEAVFGAKSGIPAAIEVFGEPDIWQARDNYTDYRKDPAAYRTFLLETHRAIRETGYSGPIIGGNISGLNKRGLEYLAATDPQTWPADIVGGYHGYPVAWPPWVPFWPPYKVGHSGYYTRGREFAALKKLYGTRELWNTEWGWTCGRQDRFAPIYYFSFSPSQQRDYIFADLDIQEQHGVAVSILYQLNSSSEDGFGIRNIDGSDRPIVEALWERFHR